MNLNSKIYILKKEIYIEFVLKEKKHPQHYDLNLLKLNQINFSHQRYSDVTQTV